MSDDRDFLRKISRRDERRARRYYKALIRLRNELDRLADQIDDLLDEGKTND